MATPGADWVEERTLGARASPFRWVLDEQGNVTVRREAVAALRVFPREHIERIQEFMADRAWHPATVRVEAALRGRAARSVQAFAAEALGWARVHREMVMHLSTLLAHAGLWEWNGQKKGVMFRQVERGMDRLRAYYTERRKGAAPPASPDARPKLRRTRVLPPQFDLVPVFRGISQGLRASLQASGGGHHPAEKGIRREAVVRDFLRARLPARYGVARGEVIASTGEASRHMDILLYDAFAAPLLLESEGSVLLAVESVYAAIEIKPVLTVADLERAAASLSQLKVLPRNALLRPWADGQPTFQPKANPPLFGAVFAFESDPPERLLDALRELTKDLRPTGWVDCVCILDKAVIRREGPFRSPNSWHPSLSDKATRFICERLGADSLLYFYLMLLRDLSAKTLLPPDLFRYTWTHAPPEPKKPH